MKWLWIVGAGAAVLVALAGVAVFLGRMIRAGSEDW